MLILKTVKRNGYKDCRIIKKTCDFFKTINKQLHAVDGSLSCYKQMMYTYFMKYITEVLYLPANQIIISHPAGNADQGEECPEHL